MTVDQVLLRIAAGDSETARVLCEQAAHTSLLAAHLLRHLVDTASDDVYTDPAAFERFISGGSNVELYAAVTTSLSEINERHQPTTLIDIGCGDGRVTTAVLPASCTAVHLLEPSDALLSEAKRALEGTVPKVIATCANVQDYLAREPEHWWDCAQATFALHNVAPDDRADTLAQLSGRTRTLNVVEFDLPDFVDKSPDHAAYVADVYEVGVAEYADDPGVIDGFLLPVLLGQFAPNRQRHTYEQSAQSWATELEEAGFQSVTTTHVCSYWWADAVLITASGALSEAGDPGGVSVR